MRRIVKQLDESDVAQAVAQKRIENTQTVLDYINNTTSEHINVLNELKRALGEKARTSGEKMNVRDVATAYGIMSDKLLKYDELKMSKANETETDRMLHYLLPANLMGKAFVDVNRDIDAGRHVEYVFKGGRGSTKSTFVSLKIIELLLRNPQLHVVCLRQVGNTLRDSVYAQVRWAILTLNMENDFKFTTSPLEITRVATGQKIYFRGGDDPAKLKSIKVPFGYIGMVWFEELDSFRGDAVVRNAEQSIIRGGDRAFIFKSFNPPRTSANWANRYVQMPKESRLTHHSDYHDVPPEWLGKVFLDEAEHLRQVDPATYEHEYMGAVNGTGGQVFDQLELKQIPDAQLKTFDRIYQGVDWGWYPDPYAFVRAHYDHAHETIYILEEHYVNKASNDETANWIKSNHYENDRIYCDSAEPKSVVDYIARGVKAEACYKRAGWVEYGMKWLQRRKIVIDPRRTPNAAREFRDYEYEKDRDGLIVSGYPDENNHIIDALRYALQPLMMTSKTSA